jgi:hypothetical protein
MEFNFRNDLENLDDRSKMANMMLKLIYQKHNGDLYKCLPEVRKLKCYLEEHVRNIYEVIDEQVPLIRYYDLMLLSGDKYLYARTLEFDSEENYQLAIKKANAACFLYYNNEGDVLQEVVMIEQDPMIGVKQAAEELGIDVSFTSSFKNHENDKSKEGSQNRREEFTKVVRPVMKWLCENHHPHTSIIIDGTNAQLLEGLASTGQIMDYVKD